MLTYHLILLRYHELFNLISIIHHYALHDTGRLHGGVDVLDDKVADSSCASTFVGANLAYFMLCMDDELLHLVYVADQASSFTM